MDKEKFEHMCQNSEAGLDAFVTNSSSNEDGQVLECSREHEHLVVRTAEGEKRCWNYKECEVVQRSKEEFPRGAS